MLLNYATKYVKRLNSEGVNSRDAYLKQSKIIAGRQICNSPNRYDVYLNLNTNEVHYCITKDKSNNKKRKFIFTPETKVNIGDYVTQGDDTYLLSEKDTNDVTPTLTGDFCSAKFTVKLSDEKVLIGYDKLNRPIYETITGEVKELPCVVKMNDASTAIADVNEPVNLLANQVMITIPYTEAPSIELNEQFNLYNETYRIIRSDPSSSINKVGILRITGEREGRNNSDEEVYE